MRARFLKFKRIEIRKCSAKKVQRDCERERKSEQRIRRGCGIRALRHNESPCAVGVNGQEKKKRDEVAGGATGGRLSKWSWRRG